MIECIILIILAIAIFIAVRIVKVSKEMNEFNAMWRNSRGMDDEQYSDND